ncbi:hypothetical protein, partial [Eubacterium callanderi]|uniref:hypothetical protein n=1 Tax=Eubacterium callanderi TaxID=53442 RepID=UPI001AA191CE
IIKEFGSQKDSQTMNSLRVFLNFSNQKSTSQNKFKNVKISLSSLFFSFQYFARLSKRQPWFFINRISRS